MYTQLFCLTAVNPAITLNFSISVTYTDPLETNTGAYKLSEDFAKPYFHKYRTQIHDVTTI